MTRKVEWYVGGALDESASMTLVCRPSDSDSVPASTLISPAYSEQPRNEKFSGRTQGDEVLLMSKSCSYSPENLKESVKAVAQTVFVSVGRWNGTSSQLWRFMEMTG